MPTFRISLDENTYKKLVVLATQNMRTPPMQASWMLYQDLHPVVSNIGSALPSTVSHVSAWS